jgi:phytoene dehydrogenase-like protein
MRPQPNGTDEREAEILRELEALQQRLLRREPDDREELRRLARGLVELVEELRRGRAQP